MLFPKSNPYRQCIDLSGYWDFRFDPRNAGLEAGWGQGLENTRPIAVPAAWNDQFEDSRDYLGDAWYQTRFNLPWGWEQQRVYVRFSSVNYQAEVWLNGNRLGTHDGGHLPFEFDATPHVRREGNLLVVRVNGDLSDGRIPPGNVPFHADDSAPIAYYPNTNFQFFPYCGILQPVLVYARPAGGLTDLYVSSEIRDGNGLVRVKATREGTDAVTVRFLVRGLGAEVERSVETSSASVEATLLVPHAALWSPQSPNLYEACVELSTTLGVFDRYTLPVGIRTVKVEGDALLLNGEKLTIKGFGLHSDMPMVGRGFARADAIKDLALMRWEGANCLRARGFPPPEEVLDVCDRIGMLVIDETTASGLTYAGVTLEKRYSLARQIAKDTVARDKNHPCVIAWSLAGEPYSRRAGSQIFLERMKKDAQEIDKSRPFTVASMVGIEENGFRVLDLICLDLYPAWESSPGQIKEGMAEFSTALDNIHEKFQKPVIMTEFAAEAIPGHHALPSEMWSEEYQAEVIAAAIQVLRSKPYVIGQMTGPLADFKTPQSADTPMGMCYRGVFTRDRRPKLAAHSLRTLWRR